MNYKIYRRISFIGILAIVAFFLPWIKACDQVDTGYSLFFTEIATRIDFDSISLLIAGLVFLLIPLYTIFSAHRISKASFPKFVKIVFTIISILAIWNLIKMGIPIFENARSELAESYFMGIYLFILFTLCLASLLSFIVYFYRWKGSGFKPILADIILLLSLIPLLLWGISFGAKFGLWIYFITICARSIAALIYMWKFSEIVR